MILGNFFFFQKNLAESVYRHQMWLAGRKKMLGSERIRITGRNSNGNSKFCAINSHSCNLFFLVGQKRASPEVFLSFSSFQIRFKSRSTRTVNRRMSLPKCSHASWPLPSAYGEAGQFFRSDAARDEKLG